MMSKCEKKVRLGIIGTGFGQQVHIPAFHSDARCDVAAVCASSLQRASEVAMRQRIAKSFGDWREMVEDPSIDAISIATPPSIQAEIAIAALAHGKAVFCEKPLATSKALALEMVKAAEQAGVANMVDFEFPEIEEWQQARSILNSNGIGNLHHISVLWNVETYANRMGLKSWKTNIEEGGGTLNSFVSHVFYYIEWFAGPVKSLSAKLFHALGDARTADTLAVLCLELESGAAVSLSVSTHAFLGSGHHIEFYGDEGTLVLDNSTPDYARGFRLLYGTRTSNRLEVVCSDDRSEAIKSDGRIPAVARLVKRFIDWIETGIPSMPSFKEGLRVQSLLEAARESHRFGHWVDVPCSP
ncbi:MAG: Gfo/Idh/MocA family oxidoreductase [Armatimonadota bacterium]|nr:Gfo/Idh/MocA family oxidoreductase [Armatimonadota bacterium]